MAAVASGRALSITIENAEADALLTELTARTHRSEPDLLRRELERLKTDAERRVADGRAADAALGGLHRGGLVDPRPIDEILAYDENGLPG